MKFHLEILLGKFLITNWRSSSIEYRSIDETSDIVDNKQDRTRHVAPRQNPGPPTTTTAAHASTVAGTFLLIGIGGAVPKYRVSSIAEKNQGVTSLARRTANHPLTWHCWTKKSLGLDVVENGPIAATVPIHVQP